VLRYSRRRVEELDLLSLKACVFDDTIEHEAWNDSDRLRVVPIFDIYGIRA
jgi:hypothetical protein